MLRSIHGSVTCCAYCDLCILYNAGRQRAELLHKEGTPLLQGRDSFQEVRYSWPIRICGEDEPSNCMQPEARANAAFLPAWVHRQYDPHTLADTAMRLFSDLFPKVGNPARHPRLPAWPLAESASAACLPFLRRQRTRCRMCVSFPSIETVPTSLHLPPHAGALVCLLTMTNL